jgi:HEAT repeat protein
VYVRADSAFTLGQLGAHEAIPELLACFKNDKDHVYVRANSAFALGQLGAKEAIPELRACLKIEKSKALVVNTAEDNEGIDFDGVFLDRVRTALGLLGEKLEPELKSLPAPVE